MEMNLFGSFFEHEDAGDLLLWNVGQTSVDPTRLNSWHTKYDSFHLKSCASTHTVETDSILLQVLQMSEAFLVP
jgi:hypothetical protein